MPNAGPHMSFRRGRGKPIQRRPFTTVFTSFMAAKSVQSLIDDIRLLGEDQYEMVQAVRALVKKSFDASSEEVKYGGILFCADVQFCGVFAYREHVSVEFGHGAKIKDPFGHLEGAGKGRRHIKLRSLSDITAKKLAEYLPLALKAAREA